MNVEAFVATCTDPTTTPIVREDSRNRLVSFLKATVKDTEVKELVESLLVRLHRPDAQTRFHALEVVDAFFLRSKIFRRVAATRLVRFVDGCVGNAQTQCALSREAVENLQHRMAHALATWRCRYGHLYPEVIIACNHVEQNLKVTLPNGSAPYVPLSEIRSRECYEEAYRRALAQKNELFTECHRVRTEVGNALDLHEQCTVEWDDLPVASRQKLHLRQVHAREDDSSKSTLHGKHRLEDVSLKAVEWMDPAVEESLSESLELMRKNLIPKLQLLISSSLHVHAESLSDPELQQRHAVMRHAIDLRNMLQDQRNKITELGILSLRERRSRARLSKRTQPMMDSDHREKKMSTKGKKFKTEGDPTEAEPKNLDTFRPELASRNAVHGLPCTRLTQREKNCEKGKTLNPVLRRLFKKAPSLSKAKRRRS